MPGRRPAFRSNPVTGSVIPHSHHSRTVSPGSGFRDERDLLHRLPAFAGGDQAGHALRRGDDDRPGVARSEEHTSELQSLMRISYAVFRLKKKKMTKSNK